MTRVYEERDGVLSGGQLLQVTQWTHEPQPVTQLSHVTYVTQGPKNCHMSPTYISHRNHNYKWRWNRNLSQNSHVSSTSYRAKKLHRTVLYHLQVTREPQYVTEPSCVIYQRHRKQNLSESCHVSHASDGWTTTCHTIVMCHLEVTHEPQPITELSHIINVTQEPQPLKELSCVIYKWHRNLNLSQNCHVSSKSDTGTTTCHRTVMCHLQATQKPATELSNVPCNNYDIITWSYDVRYQIQILQYKIIHFPVKHIMKTQRTGNTKHNRTLIN